MYRKVLGPYIFITRLNTTTSDSVNKKAARRDCISGAVGFSNKYSHREAKNPTNIMPARSLLRPHVFRLAAGESAEFIAEGQSSERCDWCETLPTSCEGFAAAKSGTLIRIASFFAILRRFDGGESAEFLVERQSSESLGLPS